MLSRKYYKAIAEIIEDNTTEIDGDYLKYNHYMIVGRNWLVQELANYFAADNPRFDRDRFMKACGL